MKIIPLVSHGIPQHFVPPIAWLQLRMTWKQPERECHNAIFFWQDKMREKLEIDRRLLRMGELLRKSPIKIVDQMDN